MSKSLEALEDMISWMVDEQVNNYKEQLDTIKQDLKAYEQLKQNHDKTLINNGELVVKVCELEKENQELKQDVEDVIEDYKDAALRMFKYDEVIEKFINYLDKEPNKAIPKHSIKQTLNKLLKEVLK